MHTFSENNFKLTAIHFAGGSPDHCGGQKSLVLYQLRFIEYNERK